jgi:hypothetical protein
MRDGFTIFDAHCHIGKALHSGRVQSAEMMLERMVRHGSTGRWQFPSLWFGLSARLTTRSERQFAPPRTFCRSGLFGSFS